MSIKKQILQDNWKKVRQFFEFTKQCILCDGLLVKESMLCQACCSDLARSAQACIRCGLTLNTEDHEVICGQCLKHPPSYDQVFASFIWQAPLSHLVSEFKFNARFDYGKLLSSLLIEDLTKRVITYPEVIIPVPLHVSRLKERGFNQSIILANMLAKRFDLPMDLSACRRIKNSPRQSSLLEKQRRKNVQDAFIVKEALSYQHVAIVDDVMTTGNTVNEMSRMLKLHGVEQVDVWVVAKTQKHME